MVRIVDGEIIPDDAAPSSSSGPASAAGVTRRNLGRIAPTVEPPHPDRPNQNNLPNEPGPNFGRSNDVSLFQVGNNKLWALGFPRWSVAGRVIEPMVSVGLIVSLLLFGWPGMVMVGFIFILSQLGQTGSLRGVYQSLIGGGVREEPRRGRPGPPPRAQREAIAAANARLGSGNAGSRLLANDSGTSRDQGASSGENNTSAKARSRDLGRGDASSNRFEGTGHRLGSD